MITKSIPFGFFALTLLATLPACAAKPPAAPQFACGAPPCVLLDSTQLPIAADGLKALEAQHVQAANAIDAVLHQWQAQIDPQLVKPPATPADKPKP